MLSKDERFKIKNSLDLREWGFEKVSQNEYRNKDFFCVSLGDLFVVLSSKRYTRAVEYDKIVEHFKSIGLQHQKMSGQESAGPNEDEK